MTPLFSSLPRLNSVLALAWIGIAGFHGNEAQGQQAAAKPAADTKAGEDLPGVWEPPPQDMPAWVLPELDLRFPIRFLDYGMSGVFTFEQAKHNHLIRYESPTQRARGDIFLIKTDAPTDSEKAKIALVDDTMRGAVANFYEASTKGQYMDMVDEGAFAGDIAVWKDRTIPLRIQRLRGTRYDQAGPGEKAALKTPLKIWIGTTIYDKYLITIRHQRAADSGDKGEEDMKRFVESITRVIKDPGLRKEVMPAFEIYVKDPLSPAGQEAAKLILGYLDNSPMVSVLLPTPPLTTWANEMEGVVTNSGSQFLKAFVITGALGALQNKDSSSCLTMACQQVARIYLEICRLHPRVKHAGLEDLVKAVERGEAATWYLKQMREAEAKESAKK